MAKVRYKYKNPQAIKKLINSPRGPNKKYVQKWGHYRTAPVICWLIEKFNLKSFVEVGCCGAQLCESVLIEFPDVQVFAVDITFGPNSNRAGMLTLAPIERLKEEYGHRFDAIEKPSLKASGDFKDKSLDLVYIDADHHYEAVKEDIRKWAPKVSDHGVLAGHDYGHRQNGGVARAVDDVLGKKNINVADYYNWWLLKKNVRI